MYLNKMSYQAHRGILLSLARESIQHGVVHGTPMELDPQQIPDELAEHRASFVTLEIEDKLRGCIGSLEASRSLAEDVVNNAFAAALKDPRFTPLQESEIDMLDVYISILSPAEPIDFSTEQDLLDQIRPEIDGLILEAAGRRGTFLPSVWQSLPEKKNFLANLKIKAGLPQDYWSDDIKVLRYTTESIR